MDLKSLPFLFALIGGALSGCASYSPHQGGFGKNLAIVGTTRDELIARMGSPEREQFADEMRVLHFPRGPLGSHTYFIYTDSNDRVLKWEQVLTEDRFSQISPGMTKEQVIDLIGISKITHGLARDRGYAWHYRYETPFCRSFVIEFTLEYKVRSTGYITRSGRRCRYVGP